ncbi:HNH endonuclease [Bacillus thuringiensis]
MKIWIPILGYEGLYELNRDGQVRRIHTKRILKSVIASNGYYVVSLWKNNKGRHYYIHRLLAESFIPNENPIRDKIVNHKDGDKLNNRLNNLEWCSYSCNNKHAYDMGLKVVTQNMKRSIRQRASVQNIGNSYRSIPILAFDLRGHFVGEFSSIKEAAEKLGVHRTRIFRFLNGRIRNPKQFTFKYKEDNVDGYKRTVKKPTSES